MMNDFRKPLFTLLTIGILATACEGTNTNTDTDAVVSATPPPIVTPDTVPTDQAIEVPTPVVEAPAEAPIDADGDGFDSYADCDDNNPDVNPDVSENTFSNNGGRNRNLIDDNCNGVTDERGKCDCEDIKGFKNPDSSDQAAAGNAPASDVPADDTTVTEPVTGGEVTAELVDKPAKKKQKNGRSYNKQCTEDKKVFEAMPGWDCLAETAPAPTEEEGKRKGKDKEQRDDQSNEPRADNSGRNRPGERPDEAQPELLQENTNSAEATPAETEASVPDEEAPAILHMIALKFEAVTQSATEFIQLAIDVNFEVGTLRCPQIPITKTNNLITFTASFADCTPSDNWDAATAQLSDIKSIQIKMPDDVTNIMAYFESIKIAAINSNGTLQREIVRFYDNAVQTKISSGYTASTYPIMDATCGVAAASNHLWDDAERAAAKALVLTPDDKQIYIKISRGLKTMNAAENPDYIDPVEVSFEIDDSNSTCTDYFNLIPADDSPTPSDYTRNYVKIFKFFTNGAISDSEFKSGGKFKNINYLGRLSSFYIEVTKAWTNEGEKKKKWRTYGLETNEIRDVQTNFEFLEVEYDD